MKFAEAFEQVKQFYRSYTNRQYRKQKYLYFQSEILNYIILANTLILILEISIFMQELSQDLYAILNILMQTIFNCSYFYMHFMYGLSSRRMIIFVQAFLIVQLITMYYIILMNHNIINFCIFIIYLAKLVQIQPFFIIKFIYFISILVLIKIFDKHFISFIILILIIFLQIISFEIRMHKFWYQIMIFVNIIESVPEAMCVLDDKNQEILFSNKKFDRLQTLLNKNQQNSMTDFDSIQQIKFLKKLQLEEISNDGFHINDYLNQLEEQLDDDIYQIKQVQFQKNKKRMKPLICDLQQSGFEEYKHSQNDRTLIANLIKTYNKLQINHEVRNKSYSFDLYFELQLNHYPQSQIQSAIRKRNKSFNINQQVSQRSRLNSIRCPEFQLNQQESNSSIFASVRKNSSSPNSCINQKIKFMLSVVDKYEINEQELPIKTLFFNDLSPLILKTKIKKLEQVKKNLMRSISHEFSTYLNGAYNCIYQFKEENENSKLIEEALNYLQLQIYKINDFQDFQSILSHQFTIRKEKLFLRSDIYYCVNLVKSQVEQKNLQIMVNFNSIDDIQIHGDQQRFHQLILNFLSNSIKFTQLGQIIINIKIEQGGTEENMLMIEICDSGIGMEQEQIGLLTKKVKLSFSNKVQFLGQDEDQKISKNSVGIGMGLTVCKSIIEKMGPSHMNKLFVESQKYEGTKFYFFLNYIQLEYQSIEDQINQPSEHNLDNRFAYLKVSKELKSGENIIMPNELKIQFKQNSTNVDQLQLESNLKDKQSFQLINCDSDSVEFKSRRSCRCNEILIVDDESFNLNALTYIMQKKGYKIRQGYNGQQAVEILMEKLNNKCCNNCQIFTCILMDINMPVMDGWKAMKKIREIEVEIQYRQIPAIAITAFSTVQDQEKCLSSGFNYVIVKPATAVKIKNAFSILDLKYEIVQD